MNAPKTILLVDDCENDIFILRAAFKKAGSSFPLQEVHNGEEAVSYLGGKGAYGDRARFPLPTIMLLDLKMPRMNGFEVLGWVRAQPGLKRMAIIIMTASMRRDDIERAFDLGATSFLVKPSSLEALAAMMRCLSDWVHISHFATPVEAVKGG